MASTLIEHLDKAKVSWGQLLLLLSCDFFFFVYAISEASLGYRSQLSRTMSPTLSINQP